MFEHGSVEMITSVRLPIFAVQEVSDGVGTVIGLGVGETIGVEVGEVLSMVNVAMEVVLEPPEKVITAVIVRWPDVILVVSHRLAVFNASEFVPNIFMTDRLRTAINREDMVPMKSQGALASVCV